MVVFIYLFPPKAGSSIHPATKRAQHRCILCAVLNSLKKTLLIRITFEAFFTSLEIESLVSSAFDFEDISN